MRRGLFNGVQQFAQVVGLAASLWSMAASAVTLTVSPSVISNTYSGAITLQAGGLTNGETVVVQKFTDINTNGVIDAADWPIQQFSLTDGYASVIGGVTNLNVPYDATPVDGAITAKPSFLTAGIAPQFVGKYLYRLSSPTGRFTPLTNLFTVTNVGYAQSFSGNVQSSVGGTNVPNAGVIVFVPSPDGDGLGRAVAGTVANNSGAYTIRLPAGTYLLWAFQNGYFADLTTAPVLTLGAGVAITTNLTLLPGDRTITGRVVDAANSALGLPGVMAAWSSSSGRLSVQFCDTSGNYSASVSAGQWEFGGDDAPFTLLGYLSLETWPGVDTSSGSVSGVTIAVPKGTAMFYGSVKDEQDRPLPGISLYGRHNYSSGPYTSSAYTDQDGKYVMLVSAGLWGEEVDAEYSGSGNYLFSPSVANDITFANGQAVQRNFTALLATNRITGWVRQTNSTPIVGVQVWAEANIAGKDYRTWGWTDAAGNYALPVANGSWTVGLNCYGGDDSLENFGNYDCPQNQTVSISNNTAVAQFTVRPPEPPQMTTTTLPEGTVGSFYSQPLTASGGRPPYHWYLPGGTPLGIEDLYLSDDGILSGIPSAVGTYNFQVVVANYDAVLRATQVVSLTIRAPLRITTTSLPAGTQNSFYSQQLAASGGQQPYHWFLPGGTSTLPPGTMSLADDGTLSGVPSGAGTFNFWVGVQDNTWSVVVTQLLSLTINSSSPLGVTTTSLPPGTNGTFYSEPLQATGGQPPYSWRVPAYSADLPANLTLATNGVLSGTPVENGTFYFDVEVDDAAANAAYQTLALTIVNPPPPPLVITNAALASGTVGAFYSTQLYATGGRAPYVWSLATGSANPPPGLTLYSSGVISGTPTTNKVSTFKVQVVDADFAVTNKILSITINPKPLLSAPAWLTNRFAMRLTGATGQTYTVQYSTTLTDWNALFVTNNPVTNSFMVVDPNATNSRRFYRVLLGP